MFFSFGRPKLTVFWMRLLEIDHSDPKWATPTKKKTKENAHIEQKSRLCSLLPTWNIYGFRKGYVKLELKYNVLSREHLGYDVKICLRKVFFRDFLGKHVLFSPFNSIFRTDTGKEDTLKPTFQRNFRSILSLQLK